jgi:hypothetical protein
MDDRTLRSMNALAHHVEMMRLVETVRPPERPRSRGGPAARPDLRLAAWLGRRLVRWGTELSRRGRPAGRAPAGAGSMPAAGG